jgi:hypothetical protein
MAALQFSSKFSHTRSMLRFFVGLRLALESDTAFSMHLDPLIHSVNDT